MNCKTCLLSRLPLQTFKKLHHLPDPMLMSAMKTITNVFQIFFGKVTTEGHHPSRKLARKNLPGIPFNPSTQHALNTSLIIECTKCNKPLIAYARKKISIGRVRAFKRVTYDLLLVCRYSEEEELVGSKIFKEFHICQNLKCIDEVEVLYYSAGLTSCCSH